MEAPYLTTGKVKNSHDFLSGAVLFEHLPNEYGALQGSSGYVSADTSGHVYVLFLCPLRTYLCPFRTSGRFFQGVISGVEKNHVGSKNACRILPVDQKCQMSGRPFRTFSQSGLKRNGVVFWRWTSVSS